MSDECVICGKSFSECLIVHLTKCQLDAVIVPSEALRDRVAELEAALRDIIDLIQQLPSGCDESADPDNTTPEDMIAHVGGLVLQRARAAVAELRATASAPPTRIRT